MVSLLMLMYIIIALFASVFVRMPVVGLSCIIDAIIVHRPLVILGTPHLFVVSFILYFWLLPLYKLLAIVLESAFVEGGHFCFVFFGNLEREHASFFVGDGQGLK